MEPAAPSIDRAQQQTYGIGGNFKLETSQTQALADRLMAAGFTGSVTIRGNKE